MKYRNRRTQVLYLCLCAHNERYKLLVELQILCKRMNIYNLENVQCIFYLKTVSMVTIILIYRYTVYIIRISFYRYFLTWNSFHIKSPPNNYNNVIMRFICTVYTSLGSSVRRILLMLEWCWHAFNLFGDKFLINYLARGLVNLSYWSMIDNMHNSDPSILRLPTQ